MMNRIVTKIEGRRKKIGKALINCQIQILYNNKKLNHFTAIPIPTNNRTQLIAIILIIDSNIIQNTLEKR